MKEMKEKEKKESDEELDNFGVDTSRVILGFRWKVVQTFDDICDISFAIALLFLLVNRLSLYLNTFLPQPEREHRKHDSETKNFHSNKCISNTPIHYSLRQRKSLDGEEGCAVILSENVWAKNFWVKSEFWVK